MSLRMNVFVLLTLSVITLVMLPLCCVNSSSDGDNHHYPSIRRASLTQWKAKTIYQANCFLSLSLSLVFSYYARSCVCVCVCVREREREGEQY